MRAVTLRSITRSGLALCALSLLGCNGPSQPSAKNALVSVRLPFAALTRIRMHQLVAKLCARHRTAVLLVTHDVDEAVLLADRVVVLRDGALGLNLPITLPRPRTRGTLAFAALRRELLAELGVIEQVGA